MHIFVSKRLGWGLRIGAISGALHPEAPRASIGFLALCVVLGAILGLYMVTRVGADGVWHW
jgi:hypothetical protein